MSCLIIDIQKNALDPNCTVSVLLRRAYATSIKLDLTQISKWIENELKGYDVGTTSSEIPDYRQYKCMLQGFNPYYGWQNIIIPDRELEDTILHQVNHQSVPELEKLILGKNDKQLVFFEISMAGHQVDFIHKLINATPSVKKLIPISCVEKILSSVRQTILEWALALEKSGIKGDNMIFSDDEKTLAQNVTIIHQQQGIAGNFTNSPISQVIHTSSIKGNIKELVEHLTQSLNLDENDIESLKIALERDPKTVTQHQGFGTNVSKWFSDVISKTASGVLSGSATIVSQKIIEALNRFYFG